MEEISNLSLHDDHEDINILDNSKRAKKAIVAFWVIIGFIIISLVPSYFEIQLLQDAQNGNYVGDSEADTINLIQAISGFIYMGLYILSSVTFLSWFRRAYGNLDRLGVDVEYKDSMAIWAWIIPFISLFRPVKMMNTICEETQRKLKEYDLSYITKNLKVLLGLWWALFIISNFIGRYLIKGAFKQDSLEQVIEYSQALFISDLFQIPEAILVLIIIYQVSAIENKLAQEIKLSGGKVTQKQKK